MERLLCAPPPWLAQAVILVLRLTLFDLLMNCCQNTVVRYQEAELHSHLKNVHQPTQVEGGLRTSIPTQCGGWQCRRGCGVGAHELL